jgi:hypothetical protein
MDVAVWLRSLGLEQYVAAFRENEVSERVLASLTQEDLKESALVCRSPPDAVGSYRCAECRQGRQYALR